MPPARSCADWPAGVARHGASTSPRGPQPARIPATPWLAPSVRIAKPIASSEAAAPPALIGWAGGPLLLDDSVELVGQLLGLADAPAARPDTDDEGPSDAEAIADPAPSALTVLSD